jgi:hypothetical protein
MPAKIIIRVHERKASGQSVDQAMFEDVARELGVSSWSLCKKLYYRYRKSSQDSARRSVLESGAAPTGRQMFLLQKWGASPGDAFDLINQLQSAAGSQRAVHIDQLFNRMENCREWDGGRRVAWLEHQARKMASNPVFWPPARARRAITGTDLVIKALREARSNRATKAELVRKTGKSANAIAALTPIMVRNGDIVRLAPGVYALPKPSASQNLWRPAQEALMEALAAAPGNAATIAELIVRTSRGRSALDAAIYRLIEAGRIVRVRRGVFALPAKKTA